jgi:putative ABC transport system permease protein
MINNYLLIALRHIRKHFNYSLINIAGLSLGLAICLLLTIWVRHELSFDSFHTNYQRLYRLGLEYSFGGQTAKTAQSPTALLPAMIDNFEEVETGVRFYNSAVFRPFVVRRDDALFEESSFYFADSTFFDVFSFQLLSGNPSTALTEPNSVVLTQTMARKYFGDEDPLGKTLQANTREYIVTGVMNDVPSNSMFRFNFIASFSTLDASKARIWWSANYQTFVVLRDGADVAAIQEKMNALVNEAVKDEVTSAGDYVRYNMVPLSDIYLRSDTQEPEIVGNIQYVVVFSVIAGLILIIACINYINLATARAGDRAREVGVRKVSGALRTQLITQFIGESVMLTLIAFAGAVILAAAGLQLFNGLTGKMFTINNLLDPTFIVPAVMVMLVIAAMAGIYPALLITSFKVVSILKGNFKTSGRGVWLRKTLVVFQFAVSIVLIIGTIVILNQVRYIREKQLGYEKENIIMLPLDRQTQAVYEQLKTEFVRSGQVIEAARASESPVNVLGGYSISLPGTDDHGIITRAIPIDEGYVPVFGMQIAAGSNFTESDFQKLRKDTIYSFLLNEAALEALSLSLDQAVGHPVKMNGRNGTIKGVLRDFHFSSLHEPIGPLVLFTEESQWNYFFLRLASGNQESQLNQLGSIYRSLVPHRPFEYKFINERYAALYASEERMGVISSVFAGLAIIIACLGLLGLVSFAAIQKTKEISIRKVMGASAAGIVLLITSDFTKLILVAILLAVPTAWYVMENYWLTSFAYHAGMGATPFIVATIGCLVMAFATAAYQAVKAALINPAHSLRSE